MKKLIFCLLISLVSKHTYAESIPLIGITSLNSLKANPDTATFPIATFAAVNWASYLNQSINTLLTDLDNLFPGYILGDVYSGDNLKAAGRINIYYGSGRGLIIHVNRFQFMDPYTTQSDGTWDLNLFRQEKISQIELWDNTVCAYNSNQ